MPIPYRHKVAGPGNLLLKMCVLGKTVYEGAWEEFTRIMLKAILQRLQNLTPETVTTKFSILTYLAFTQN